MRAVAVTIRAVRQQAVVLEAGHAPPQIRVHHVVIARVKPGVRHAHGHSGPGETQLLCERGRSSVAVVAADNLRRGFIHQFAFGRALDPKDRAGLGQNLQTGGIEIAAQNGALSQTALMLDGQKQAAHPGDFGRRSPRRNQDIDRDEPVRQQPIARGGGQAGMYLVVGAIRPHPMDVTQRRDLVRRHVVEPGDEGIVWHIREEVNAQCAQLSPFG